VPRLGLRSAERNRGPAVPLGEGQAQHSRRQRGPLVQAAAAQRAAKGEPRAVRRRRGVTRGGMRFLLGALPLPFWGEGAGRDRGIVDAINRCGGCCVSLRRCSWRSVFPPPPPPPPRSEEFSP